MLIIGDFNLIRHRLESLFPNAKRKMQPAFEALERIIALARSCGVSRKIIFRPTLARNAEFFRGGFMFECVKRGRSSKDGKLRELIAFGGRSVDFRARLIWRRDATGADCSGMIRCWTTLERRLSIARERSTEWACRSPSSKSCLSFQIRALMVQAFGEISGAERECRFEKAHEHSSGRGPLIWLLVANREFSMIDTTSSVTHGSCPLTNSDATSMWPWRIR